MLAARILALVLLAAASPAGAQNAPVEDTDTLDHAGILAFLHSFAGGCLVASAIAAAGALLAASLLPARPGAPRYEAPQPAELSS